MKRGNRPGRGAGTHVLLGVILLGGLLLSARQGGAAPRAPLLNIFPQPLVLSEAVRVGQFVRYRQSGGPELFTWELAAVGKETVDSKEQVWLELHFQYPNRLQGREMTMKSLYEVESLRTSPWGVPARPSQLIMLPPGFTAALALPPGSISSMVQQMTAADGAPKLDLRGYFARRADLPEEELRLPAGTFRTRVWRAVIEGVSVAAYFTPEVPLSHLALVTMQRKGTPEPVRVELLAMGESAATRITVPVVDRMLSPAQHPAAAPGAAPSPAAPRPADRPAGAGR
ncbi:MAG: hypothetical protein HYY96_02125 [Candidatus Tectomicrobia bacterium]|nr:hypothetical protein [Candidatus Tectomicrobia bacterium]